MNQSDTEGINRDSPERFDPDEFPGSIIAAEHLSRYGWAATAAAGKSVLDAGCGVGYGSGMLAEAGASHVVGVDNDPSAVASAATRYGDRDGLEFVEGELHELPFEDSSFDLVVCFEVIEHIERQEAALDELRRVLRDDGHLLLSSPNRDVFPPGNPYHLREYTPNELEAALGRRFDRVELWRQHSWVTSLLIDDAAAASGPETEIETSVRKLIALEPGSELYTIAVAGEHPLEGLNGAATLGEPIEIRHLVMQEVKARSEMLRAQQQLAETVEGFESSFSWRITKPLRIAKRVARRRRLHAK